LGSAYAVEFAFRGYALVLNDLVSHDNSNPQLEKLVSKLKEIGSNIAINYDSAVDGKKLVEAAISTFGRIDVIICNAGIIKPSSIASIEYCDWMYMFDVHVNGPFKLIKAAWPYMKKQHYGRVILTTSTIGLTGYKYAASYCSAKAAIIGLTKSIAVEGKKFGIVANCIAPHAASKMIDNLVDKDLLEEVKPEYVAPYVSFLASHDCPYNGEILQIGAGSMFKFRFQRSNGLYLDKENLDHKDMCEHWKTLNDFTSSKTYENEFNLQEDILSILKTKV